MPFTAEQFFDVFEKYNLAVYPMQFVLFAVAVLSIFLIFIQNKNSSRTISAVLAFLWIWIGVAYHWAYFSDINKGAYVFGTLFVLQGILFLVFGALQQQIIFEGTLNRYSLMGGIFILYALVIYPVAGYLLGHEYPRNPTFGLPCPTTIFTFGMLLWANSRFPKFLLVIPLLWSLIGISAAVSLGVWEDTALVAAGLLGTGLVLHRNWKQQAVPVIGQQTAAPVMEN